ncbi:MAG TPA: S-adenosyl-l-methionine hydroxide adenosyltransferase family protein [Candidatus Thermoplasmatota archaeon]|nr:S-adenosyl-l-methionine hydroxide adenosyltransferase family protein [Candidatus Thermoplasmatota archaeon]
MITLTTDFGQSAYVAAMKGVILRLRPDARVVDLTHEVRRGDVRHGAFLLAATVPWYPPAVHVAVVDPGVGAGRRTLLAECERGLLLGPDNGLLLPAARRLGLLRVRELSNAELWLPQVSRTFHGRDVFAPVAARLDGGLDPSEVGREVESFVDLDFGSPRVEGGRIEAVVVSIDTFGNVVTNVSEEVLASRLSLGDSLRIAGPGKAPSVEAPWLPTYGFAAAGDLLVLAGSAGFVEIAVNQGSAADRLDLHEGDAVRFEVPS